MVETVTSAIGPGRGFPTLAAWALSLPCDLVAAGQCHVAELWAGAEDPGGVVIRTRCDETCYVILRTALGHSHRVLADPLGDALAPCPGLGAMIRAETGDAVRAEGVGTRVHVQDLQIVAEDGAALSDDGQGRFLDVRHCLLEAVTSEPAMVLRGSEAKARDLALIQRGPGDGVLLADGASLRSSIIFKPTRAVAEGYGVVASGEGTSVHSIAAVGFRQAFAPGIAHAEALASDQMNIIAVPDNFADPYWRAEGASVDANDTVPGPYAVPLQWLGNIQNAFARFQGPELMMLGPGQRFSFSLVVAHPTSLASALVLESPVGKPELRIAWTETPPKAGLAAPNADLRAVSGGITPLGSGAYRLSLKAENATSEPVPVTPVFYVTRGIENTGLPLGIYAGDAMAGSGHLGTGFVYPGAVPGTDPREGIDPAAALRAASEVAPDLRVIAGGPLDGMKVPGAQLSEYGANAATRAFPDLSPPGQTAPGPDVRSHL